MTKPTETPQHYTKPTRAWNRDWREPEPRWLEDLRAGAPVGFWVVVLACAGLLGALLLLGRVGCWGERENTPDRG